MSAVGESLKGPRLEFVVRELPGTVDRFVHQFDEVTRTLEKVAVTEPAGFMVYAPNGTCQRLSPKAFAKSRYAGEPNILSIEKAKDQKTAAGRFVLAITAEARKKALAEMENEVIKSCVPPKMRMEDLIPNYNPKGKVTDA